MRQSITLTCYLLLFAIFLVVSNSCDISTSESQDEISGLPSGSKIQNIDINGRSRQYLLHTPNNWTSGEQLPLIFMFYGTGGMLRKWRDIRG